VAVEILAFELDYESQINLVARWTVLDARGTALLVRRVILQESVDDPNDYPQIVDGMSRVVLDLGREIAADIESLPTTDPLSSSRCLAIRRPSNRRSRAFL